MTWDVWEKKEHTAIKIIEKIAYGTKKNQIIQICELRSLSLYAY